MHSKHSSNPANQAQTNEGFRGVWLMKLSISGQTMENFVQVAPTQIYFLRWMQLYRTLWMLETAPKRECNLGLPHSLLHILRRLIAIFPTSNDLQRLGARVGKRFRMLLNRQGDNQRNLLRCQRNIQHMSIRASMQLYICTHRALALIQKI